MQEQSKAHRARLAIQIFKTTVDALALRGYYKPSGKSGQTLEESLKMLSPEIYGTMNNPRITELKGLEYIIDRLPRGIAACNRIILTGQEDFENTSFEKIEPPKRRRTSYLVSEKEMCFVITRGLSEIYDILSHITFLEIEAGKIKNQIMSAENNISYEWKKLAEIVTDEQELIGKDLDQAIWNLSIILGRTYQETRETYEYFEEGKRKRNSNRGLFQLIYSLGIRRLEEDSSRENMLVVYFTPSLKEMLGHHKYGKKWAHTIKEKACALNLENRPLHIISANLHSVMNLVYGYAALKERSELTGDIYQAIPYIRDREQEVRVYAEKHGFVELLDTTGTHIDCQFIDSQYLSEVEFHPQISLDIPENDAEKPVLLVIDYAFGYQAFEVMDELLAPYYKENANVNFRVDSISVMGKAGILPGNKGDIMLATAHVMEGTPHNYIVNNDLCLSDFEDPKDIYVGPIVTVLGTSLQNRDVLEKFQTTSWKAVGLEMEGGHYQRAINAAIIRGHISPDVKVRYAYYASDNPLISGQTLAHGGMGQEGIRPTYIISKIILEKILGQR